MITVLLVSYAVILGQRSWSPMVTGDSLIVLASSLAGVCSLVAVASLRGALRRAWLLLATMIVLNVAGGILWLTYGDDPGSPHALSVADALYLVAFVPLLAGLVLYPMARGLRRTWGPLLLDGLVLGSSLLLLTALLGLNEVNRSLTGSEVFVHLFYPVTDVLMMSLILVLLLRSAGPVRIDVALPRNGVRGVRRRRHQLRPDQRARRRGQQRLPARLHLRRAADTDRGASTAGRHETRVRLRRQP